MEEKNQNLKEETPEQRKSLKEEIEEYSQAAAEGKVWAIYNLAQAYFDEASRTNSNKLYKKAYQYYKKAADLGDAESCYQLAFMISEALGHKSSSADMVHYFKLYLERFDGKCADVRGGVNTQLSWQYTMGDGVRKDLPLAYEYAKRGTEFKDCEESQAWFDNLKSTYPFTDDGEIDISERKRLGLTTFLIIIGIIGSIWGFAVSIILKSEDVPFIAIPFYIGMTINLLAYLGTLSWQKWGGWLLITKLILGFIAQFVFIDFMIKNDSINGIVMSPFEQFFVSMFGDLFLVILILGFLQLRKAGYALPWCSLMKTRDDGRNLFTKVKDIIMVYGEGEAYRMHSAQTKTFIFGCQASTVLMAVLGIYCAYRFVLADIDWAMNIEWKFWESRGLWIFLSIIGFFAQFMDWQHFSFREGWLIDNGNKKKFVPNNDVLSVAEGGFIWPLIMHLLVVPAVYGAVFYYIIMGFLALLGALIPYMIGILLILYSLFFNKMVKHLYARRWRFLLLVVWTTISVLLLLLFASPSSST